MELKSEAVQAYRRTLARRRRQRLVFQEKQRDRATQLVVAALRWRLPDYPAVQRAYLFGSVIRPGAFTLRSDVDVGLEGADMGLCFEIWRDLEAALPDWPLDLRPLDDSPFAERIRHQGEVVYVRSV